MDLHDRINSVINTKAFQKTLAEQGFDLIEFQMSWLDYKSFEKLPSGYKKAIKAGEHELQSSGPRTFASA